MALNINGTTGISGVDGSASAPALTGTDANTGINFGADVIDLSTGGSSRFKVGAAGQLGVAGANYGTSGQALLSQGASAAPQWGTVAGGGKVLQVVQESKKNTASETVGSGTNDNSSGLTGDLISKAIIPSNASNLILVRASLMVGISHGLQVFAQLFKAGSVLDAARGDSSVRQQVSAATYVSSDYRLSTITHEYLDTAGGTSSITYSYRFSHDSSVNRTIYLNRDHTNNATTDYVRGYSSLTLMEIEP